MFSHEKYATGRLNWLFANELKSFWSDFDLAPVPVEQDLRAGVIGWIATFAPEAIGDEGERELWRISTAVRERSDFRHFGWYRTPYLDVARFSLSKDSDAIAYIIANLDHHKSSLRSALHAPLALIAPRLSLSHPELSSRIENALKHGLFFNESLMCIFFALRGNHQRKIELVKDWRNRIDLSPMDAETLDNVIAGDAVSNNLIADELTENLQYLFCRLLDPELGNVPPRKQLDLFDGEIHAIWKRMSGHPLVKSSVLFPKG